MSVRAAYARRLWAAACVAALTLACAHRAAPSWDGDCDRFEPPTRARCEAIRAALLWLDGEALLRQLPAGSPLSVNRCTQGGMPLLCQDDGGYRRAELAAALEGAGGLREALELGPGDGVRVVVGAWQHLRLCARAGDGRTLLCLSATGGDITSLLVAAPRLLPDEDADGLPRPRDRCPARPEDYNGVDDDDGCPEGQEEYPLTLTRAGARQLAIAGWLGEGQLDDRGISLAAVRSAALAHDAIRIEVTCEGSPEARAERCAGLHAAAAEAMAALGSTPPLVAVSEEGIWLDGYPPLRLRFALVLPEAF
ncbi:MAG: hypothetical protein KC468_16230 [Myxococcales bacterium]|nr:hypothetical protein [Myxococcales bacterium]